MPESATLPAPTAVGVDVRQGRSADGGLETTRDARLWHTEQRAGSTQAARLAKCDLRATCSARRHRASELEA